MYSMEVEYMAHRVWAWIDANPGAVGEKRLTTIARKAHKQTMTEFAAGGVRGNKQRALSHRFSESFGERALRRSPQYEDRVRGFYGGRYLPFMSPTKAGVKGMGGHLQKTIKVPNVGYRLRARNGTDIVKTTLILPTARKLNFHPQYRKQFLALDGFNRADGEAIEQRVKELMLDGLRNEINRAKSRRLKSMRAAGEAFAELA